MSHDAKQDPLFEAVKQLVIETGTPSISFVQRTYRINYSRAASMLEAMEGEVVSSKDEHGKKKMLQERPKQKNVSTPLLADWGDSKMNTFDAAFFNELDRLDALVKLDEYSSILMPPLDGFRLRLSQLWRASKVGDDFARLTRNFIDTLDMRSDGRYLFEEDFQVYPYQVRSFSKGRSGRKQLYVGFDAYPPSDLVARPWGVSIGLCFDFRDKHGIVTACANEYEAFYEKVYCDQELFDATFGNLGGYAEPIEDFKEPVTAANTCQYTPVMLQSWLFFGKRLKPDDITALGSLEVFVDECIRVFDVICKAGYYDIGVPKAHNQLEIGPGLFENFVVGKANQSAHAAALRFVHYADNPPSPLFIYGSSGTGKTHLMQAIGNEFWRNKYDAEVGYVSALVFIHACYYRATDPRQYEEFAKYFHSLELLLIDDIQAIAHKPNSQKELLNVLDWAIEAKKKVVVTCDKPLDSTSGFEPRLLSRLCGGLSVALNPPDIGLRKAFALERAPVFKNSIPEEVIDFIANLVASNIRELEGACRRIEAYAIFHNRPITLDLAKEALKDILQSRNCVSSQNSLSL